MMTTQPIQEPEAWVLQVSKMGIVANIDITSYPQAEFRDLADELNKRLKQFNNQVFDVNTHIVIYDSGERVRNIYNFNFEGSYVAYSNLFKTLADISRDLKICIVCVVDDDDGIDSVLFSNGNESTLCHVEHLKQTEVQNA